MVIYGLFNTYSYQASLSNVEYLGKTYDVKNEFFWLSKAEIKELADENYYSKMGFDLEKDDERFTYLWLKNHDQYISKEAKTVLELSKLVIKETFSIRKILNEDYPEYNLMRWDAGWEQIRRLMIKTKKTPTYTKLFLPSYQELEKKINGYIYTYGFLE